MGNLSYSQFFFQIAAVESQKYLSVDIDHRHAHLVGLHDHFLGRLPVDGHVHFLELDVVFLEKLLGHAAVDANRSRIYFYFHRDDISTKSFLLATAAAKPPAGGKDESQSEQDVTVKNARTDVSREKRRDHGPGSEKYQSGVHVAFIIHSLFRGYKNPAFPRDFLDATLSVFRRTNSFFRDDNRGKEENPASTDPARREVR